MTAFPNWHRFAVRQRRCDTGCIATGFEMILRAAGVPGIAFDTFQDEFDLDRDRLPGSEFRNNFESVAAAVHKRYPHVRLVSKVFAAGRGIDKVKFVEERVAQQRPVLVSLRNEGGYHIMPVVDATDDSFTLLEYVDERGCPHTCSISKHNMAYLHDHYRGGDDVAFLEVPVRSEAISGA
jgi:hypothetical protein